MFEKDLGDTIVHREAVRLHPKLNNSETQSLRDAGIFMHPLVNLYNKWEYTASRTLLSNGIFTNTDLCNFGYDVDPTCSDCGLALDTVFHRCYSCPGIEATARRALGNEPFDSIIEHGPDSLLATRLSTPQPQMTEGPSDVTIAEFVNMAHGYAFSSSGGEVFGDGSCIYPSFAPLARAGLAIVQVSEDGNLDRAVYGAIPAALPQTSLAAEYGALSAAYDNSIGVNYVGDCEDVVRSVNGPVDAALTSRSPHACTWRLLLHRYGEALGTRVLSAIKTKAHRHLSDVEESANEKRRYWGNFLADQYAKLGGELHAPPPCDVICFKKNRVVLVKLAYHMVDVLGTLRLSRVESNGRVPRLPVLTRHVATEGSPKDSHCFKWYGKCWVCIKCFFRTVHPSSVSPTRKYCKGVSPMAAVLHADRGHRLWTSNVHGGGEIVYCSKCWGYASAYPRKLLHDCSPVPLSCSHAIRDCILERRHPRSKARIPKPARLHVI